MHTYYCTRCNNYIQLHKIPVKILVDIDNNIPSKKEHLEGIVSRFLNELEFIYTLNYMQISPPSFPCFLFNLYW